MKSWCEALLVTGGCHIDEGIHVPDSACFMACVKAEPRSLPPSNTDIPPSPEQSAKEIARHTLASARRYDYAGHLDQASDSDPELLMACNPQRNLIGGRAARQSAHQSRMLISPPINMHIIPQISPHIKPSSSYADSWCPYTTKTCRNLQHITVWSSPMLR